MILLQNGMDRKEFIKKGSCGVCVALGSGFVMSALLSACKTPLGVIKTTAKDKMLTVPLTEFATADYKLVRVANYDYDLAIQKEKDGTYTTLLLKCSHAGQPVTKTGSTYYCTLHGSQFSHDGKVMKGPASTDMTKLKTVVDGGNLLIHL